MRKVVIFKNKLGEYSETFIYQQAESLKEYSPLYICSRFKAGGLLPKSKNVISICHSNFSIINEILFIFGITARKYLQVINQAKPALVHAHFAVDCSLLAKFRKKINTKKLVCTIHGYDVTVGDEYAKKSFLIHRLYLKNREQLKDNVDIFIAVSKFIEKRLILQGFPKQKIVQHYIGVDTELFSPTVSNSSSDVKSIVFVGRFVEKKGIFDLLSAAKNLLEQGVDCRFDIIGDGPLKRDVENIIKEKKLTNVVLHGKKTQHEIIEYLDKAYLFCVPSKTAKNGDSEAFGIVFIEAQAMGVPIVSYDHGGINEAVSNGKTGLLAEEGNTTQLTAYLLELCLDTKARNELASNCRRFVIDNFDLKLQNEKLEHIYDKLLETK
jgi:glycosyltransferase involved in cell wall biosynthesis